MNAALWIMRTDAPRRDLPPDYGGWSNTHRRFIRWRDKYICEKLLEILIDEPDDRCQSLQGASSCGSQPTLASTADSPGANQA